MTKLNLLPERERKLIRTEYHLRLVIVILLALLITFFVGIAVLTPSYFLTISKEETVFELREFLQQSQAQHEESDVVGELAEIKEKIKLLVEEEADTPIYAAIGVVINRLSDGITLTRFSYEGGANGVLIIVGEAATRDELLAFSKALKDEAVFSEVELPVSNLAKDQDIEFSITLRDSF